MATPYVLGNVEDLAGKLTLGEWVLLEYRGYGLLDRAEWNAELVHYLEERGVVAEVIDLPAKQLVVVVNAACPPSFEQVTESIAAIDHHRFTGRPIGEEVAVKTRRHRR